MKSNFYFQHNFIKPIKNIFTLINYEIIQSLLQITHMIQIKIKAWYNIKKLSFNFKNST